MKASKLLSTALAAGMLGAVGFVALPSAASAQPVINLNQWYTGHFTATGSPIFAASGSGTAYTHGPILPWPNFGNAIDLPATTTNSWAVFTSNGGTLTVTDVQTSGDRFALFDNGNPMAPANSPFGPAPQNPGQAAVGNLTSAPCNFCEVQGSNPDINYFLGDANYSSGTFALYAGWNVISGTFVGVVTFGDVNLIAEAVPEPSTWAMMTIGFAGLGFAGYRMRKQTAALPV
jgi:PEP-CTERM motif